MDRVSMMRLAVMTGLRVGKDLELFEEGWLRLRLRKKIRLKGWEERWEKKARSRDDGTE